jgi:hypothetical protein
MFTSPDGAAGLLVGDCPIACGTIQAAARTITVNVAFMVISGLIVGLLSFRTEIIITYTPASRGILHFRCRLLGG